MDFNALLLEARGFEDELRRIRRDLHQHPELGFDLPYTRDLVTKKLIEMGYDPRKIGKGGIIAMAGHKTEGPCILLRADMDALPIEEEADVEYKSKTPGKMHACGHDMHTAMLLGTAKLLKEHEDELEGMVKLEFQPAEEPLQGSIDMLENGLLEDPHVDAAVMIHVISGMPMPEGTLLVPGGGVGMASCDIYHITVTGKGGHGSTPHTCVDPITAAAQMHLALQEINSRELDAKDFGVFTTCKFTSGTAQNVLPDTAEMWGTIRTIDPEYRVATQIMNRMKEICKGVALAMRCDVNIEFYGHCPCMVINEDLAHNALKYMKELLGDRVVFIGSEAGGGSEDFAFVSHEVPTISMYLISGNSNNGYIYGQHSPKVRFDDSILYIGSTAYAGMALMWLKEHSA